ncbi:MAG TPA: hypothetical protein ENN67_03900 [Firmicutes bacterium]|nr:hypothetical protein [Bacillota bacterium]
MVLIDLDESECAPLILKDYLPDPAPFMCLSIAVREVESWLMADRERIAKFLSVSQSIIPHDCDSIENPKEKLVDIARKSRRADIREDIVPRKGSGIKIGPAYTSRLVEFVLDETNGWRPESAARSSPSLNRCIERIVGTVNKIRTAKL